MSSMWKAVILITVVMVAFSCAQPETEEPQMEVAPTAAAPETGPDPTVVDPDHYLAEFENERVRVVRIKYGPGEQSVMHYHPDSVAVFLTPHHAEFEKPDGTSEEVRAGAGEHVFSPAEQHLPKNLGTEPFELVLVELKPAGPGTGAAAAEEPGPDPTVVDADHYKTEFENDHVRIVRINYGPGDESVMHYHPDSVAVFLTPHHVEFGKLDGTSEEVQSGAGEVAFAPAEQHLPKNLGSEPLEVVLVELKGP